MNQVYLQVVSKLASLLDYGYTRYYYLIKKEKIACKKFS